jgi:hypothetical protein
METMGQEQIQARHLVELGFLESIFGDMGYQAQLVESSAEIAYPVLLVELDPDEMSRPRQMALTFYPVGEEDLENTMLLQYFLELPFELSPEGRERAAELLPYVNNKVVLGHFGLGDKENRVHYRYVQALRQDQVVSREAVVDVIVLLSYTPVLFQPVLEALAQGALSVREAREQIDAQYAGM